MAAREPAGAADSLGWEPSLQFMFFEIKTEEEEKKKQPFAITFAFFRSPAWSRGSWGSAGSGGSPGAVDRRFRVSIWRVLGVSPVPAPCGAHVSRRTRRRAIGRAQQFRRLCRGPRARAGGRAAEREEPEGPSRRRSQSLGFGAPPPAAGCRGSAPRAGLRPLVPLATRPPLKLHMVTSPWGAGGGRLYKRVFPEGTPATPAAPNS